MACATTLKRHHAYDPVHDGPHGVVKRRRCVPRTLASAIAPTKQHQITPSPFSDAMPELDTDEIMARLSQHFKSLSRRNVTSSSSSTNASRSASPSSGPHHLGPHPMGPHHPGQVPPQRDAMNSMSIEHLDTTDASAAPKKDVPLFTLKQVGLVCERMLKERQDQLQEEYQKVLNCKLADQYEAFLKFNQDQLHRRFGESAASYVS